MENSLLKKRIAEIHHELLNEDRDAYRAAKAANSIKPDEEDIFKKEWLLKRKWSYGNNILYNKYLVIWQFFNEDKSVNEIVEVSGLSKRTVYNYIAIFKRKGKRGLAPKKHKGAIPKLSSRQLVRLEQIIIDKSPSDCGFTKGRNWTADLLCQYVERKYGVLYSRSGMSVLLKKMDFHYVNGKYVFTRWNT